MVAALQEITMAHTRLNHVLVIIILKGCVVGSWYLHQDVGPPEGESLPGLIPCNTPSICNCKAALASGRLCSRLLVGKALVWNRGLAVFEGHIQMQDAGPKLPHQVELDTTSGRLRSLLPAMACALSSSTTKTASDIAASNPDTGCVSWLTLFILSAPQGCTNALPQPGAGLAASAPGSGTT